MNDYILAKLWRRGLAWWLDLLVVSIPPCIWLIGVWSDIGGRYRVESWYQKYLWQDWLPWAWFLASFLYYAVCEAIWGATLGKMLTGIVVVREDGSPCGWHPSLMRNCCRIFDGCFFWWVGAVFIIFTRRKQRPGDMAAKTLVIQKSTGTCITNLLV